MRMSIMGCQENVKRIVEDFNKSVYPHSKEVVEICQMIASELQKYKVDVQEDKLIMAAYLHDIGKGKFKEMAHSYASVVCMYCLFDCEENRKTKKYAQEISSIIISHNGVFCPEESVAIEAAILRIADKIVRFGQKKDAEKKYKESLRKIKRCFEFDGVDFETFEDACDCVKIRIKDNYCQKG